MTRIRRHLLASAAVAAVLIGVSGCGGSNDEPEGAQLPASTVRQLDLRLDEIQRRYDSATQDDNTGACDDIASDSFPAVSRLIDSLPADTDQGLKDAVTESFSNLQQLTDSGCQDVGTDTETETTPTETTPTETTPPPETETIPPETETIPPETTPPATPPDPADPGTNGQGGGGSGGDNGNGQGGAEAPGN